MAIENEILKFIYPAVDPTCIANGKFAGMQKRLECHAHFLLLKLISLFANVSLRSVVSLLHFFYKKKSFFSLMEFIPSK